MQVVRLVKSSDLYQVTKLIKKTGIGMTTMPKNKKEVQERIEWSIASANKKSANPNKDTYLFVLEKKSFPFKKLKLKYNRLPATTNNNPTLNSLFIILFF